MQGGKTQEEVEKAIKAALEGNKQRVKDLSSEKTILFDPDAVPTVSATPVTTMETPATINQGNTQTGAAYTTQKEQAINNKKASRTRHKLRKVKSPDYEKWDEKKELKWLNKVLPQLSESDRVKVVKGLIKVGKRGALAWGQFDKGVITLSDIAAEGTAYHEAFHAVFNLLLDNSERQALYDEARKLYGEKDNLSLEEDMAEGFREYVTTRQNAGLLGKIKNFFKDLWIKVTNWNSIRPHLTAYYQMINRGEYSNRELPVETLSQARARQEEYSKEMQDILAKAPRNSEGKLLVKPGGPVSNLTERQYAQVRTKEFKDWFGDWETANKENPYSKDISIGPPEADFSNVDAAGTGVLIPIFLNGEYIGETGLDNALYHKDKGISIKGKYMEMPSVGGSNITIEEEYRGKGYGKATYFELAKLAANNGKILRSASDKSRTPASTRVWESLVRDGYAKRVNDKYEFINSTLNEASKVVDENGEPLVVYHATNKIFNTYKERDGIHFGSYNTALGVANEKFDPTFDTIEEAQASIAKGKFRINQVFLNIRNPKQSKDLGTGWKQLITEGFDGGLYSAVEGDTSFVVFDSNQIKSATDNVGTFSRTNDDIRYREVPNSSFESLSTEMQENLLKKGWTAEKFDSISQEERDQAVKCIAF